jgi:hypothetical protein
MSCLRASPVRRLPPCTSSRWKRLITVGAEKMSWKSCGLASRVDVDVDVNVDVDVKVVVELEAGRGVG